MASMSKHMLLNHFIFPVADMEIDHEIDHTNIHGLERSNFFILSGSYIIVDLN